MRIQILSDLHNEFSVMDPVDAGADAVVLAGDIDLGTQGYVWARSAFPGRPVVYVAGNHEYYRNAIPSLTRRLIGMKNSGSISFLECGEAEIMGFRFLGCTLWSDFGLNGDARSAMELARVRMNDYDKIRLSPGYRRLRPADTVSRFAESVRWLDTELAHDADRTVVVTHHAPSERSIDPAFVADPINGAFASDLEELITRRSPALWIHGHTHFCVDYTIGRTRVISNQRGYSHLPVGGFDPALVVELRAPAPPGESNSGGNSVSS